MSIVLDVQSGNKAHVVQDVFTQLYSATLLGGEFDNCHGQGDSIASALISLRIVVRIRRKLK